MSSYSNRNISEPFKCLISSVERILAGSAVCLFARWASQVTLNALVDRSLPEPSLTIGTHQLSDQCILQAWNHLSLQTPPLCHPLHPPLPVPGCSLTLLHPPLCLQPLFDCPLGWFLFRKVWNFKFGMLPNCCHLLTDFRTVFVFALGPFLPMLVIFSTLMGAKTKKGSEISEQNATTWQHDKFKISNFSE